MTFPIQHRRCARLVVACALLTIAAGARAWESDVHYGLTYWLAVKAGFNEREARLIATGDQRVDSGDMQYIEPLYAFACLGSDDTGTRRVGENHYPSLGPLPGPPEGRAVIAGSEAANRAVALMAKVPASQAGFMLHKLGEALHSLQDSWSHQGVVDVPPVAVTLFACDRTRVWAHPKARGGWSSHKADLTRAWPADTVATAKATYDVLLKFPPTAGTARDPVPWEKLRPSLDAFIKAATKSEKAKWFTAQKVDDLSFLAGISLKDGSESFDVEWPGRRFPPVPTDQSRQHHIDEDLLDFYHAFFEQWVGGKDMAAVAKAFVAPAAKGAGAPISAAELTSRLKVWRLRDHGRVAELAHVQHPLSAQQRGAIDAIARERDAIAVYETPNDAYFPILPRTGTSEVSPLLPFLIKPFTPNGNRPRAAAVVKFRHAPYDLVAVVAEKFDKDWKVIAIVPAVDH